MSFSPEWDSLYQSNTHLSVWPWSDLVSYVHRYAAPANGYSQVLELGCGAGANIPLFLKLGASYSGIDGSETIIQRLKDVHPKIASRLVVADFTQGIPFDGHFDLVVDRASTPHNHTSAIARTLKLVNSKLRPGGKFIGIDWFSDRHQDFERAGRVDANTRKAFPPDSHLAGTGIVHFFSGESLTRLLEGAGFRLDRLEHKEKRTFIPAERVLGWWDFVAVKP